VFQLVGPLFAFAFIFLYQIKIGTRTSVGEISQAQLTHIRDLPPTRCTTLGQSIMQEGQDK
jgi:hypothetical protein